jgi:stage V sporulation protein B
LSESAAAAPSAPSQPAAPSDAARSAGRGGIAVLGAKAFFIVTGLLQQTLLPHMIGLAGFGELGGRVFPTANIINNVMVATGTQGVSRVVASAREHRPEALRMALKVHVVLALAAGALFAAAAPAIAAFEHAEYVTVPLVTMGGVVACYGLYAALIGVLNGTERFGKQASLDVTFAVLRTGGLLGVGWLFVHRGGSGVLGSTVGFVGAAACIVPLALRWTGTGRAATVATPDIPPVRAYLAMLVPLAIAQLFTNALMQTDITLLGRFLSESASRLFEPEAARKASDEWVGVYRACQLFAFLPYQLLFSVTQVLFPMVAKAHAGGQRDEVRTYVARGARIGTLACGLMVAVIAAMPQSLLGFAFSHDVAERGRAALPVLAVGLGAFAMLGLASTVLVSIGREREAAMITLVALVFVVAGCFGIVPGRDFGAAQLLATACATCLALVVGLSVAAARVAKTAGAFVPVATAARVFGAVAVTVAIGSRLPPVGRLLMPVEAAVMAVIYLVALVAMREVGAEDRALVLSLVRKRKA